MEFSREGNHTIRCVITEEEIEELGYTIDEIISNGARTQEFMNRIFDMAEKEFQMKFETGVKAVRADILPDHTISLTFSEHPGTEGMMEHIKEIVNGLLGNISKQKWEELQNLKTKENIETEAGKTKGEKTSYRIVVLFMFESLDVLIRYAKQVTMEYIPYNQLYKMDDAYFLMLDVTDSEEAEVKYLSALTDEYATDVFVGADKRAFIYEHGRPLLMREAIQTLKMI